MGLKNKKGKKHPHGIPKAVRARVVTPKDLSRFVRPSKTTQTPIFYQNQQASDPEAIQFILLLDEVLVAEFGWADEGVQDLHNRLFERLAGSKFPS